MKQLCRPPQSHEEFKAELCMRLEKFYAGSEEWFFRQRNCRRTETLMSNKNGSGLS